MIKHIALILAFLLMAVGINACTNRHKMPPCLVQIGDAKWAMEIARTEDEREKGLMFRRYLPDDAGMVFVFEKPRKVAMWMKNTYVPLDMLFVTPRQTISGYVQNATPLSEDALYSPGVVGYVIELSGGQVAKSGIHVGQTLDLLRCPALPMKGQ